MADFIALINTARAVGRNHATVQPVIASSTQIIPPEATTVRLAETIDLTNEEEPQPEFRVKDAPKNEPINADLNEQAEEDDGAHMYSPYESREVRKLYPNVVPHPDPLVETASLAAVELPKLDPTTNNRYHNLKEDVDAGRISDAQLEAVIYAGIRFKERLPDGARRGFLLGDGAGVGKGRTIAALIKDHYKDKIHGGKRILWVSVSQDLRKDARRDLTDMDAEDIEIFEPYGKRHIPVGNFNGVVFVTYSLLRSGLVKPQPKRKNPFPSSRTHGAGGVIGKSFGGGASMMLPSSSHQIFVVRDNNDGEMLDDDHHADHDDYSYDELEHVPHDSRLAQILTWLQGEGGPVLIIFDESHRAKNLIPDPKKNQTATLTALAVMHLQNTLPNAKIVYSSATGASAHHHLAYMNRLWGKKATKDVVELLGKSNIGALELAAMSLKATGSYLARSLSYQDAEFELKKIEIPKGFRLMYDRACAFWTFLYKVMSLVGLKRWPAQFWAAHQRFFRSMLMAAKVPYCAKLSIDAVSKGMSVVIGLQSTGEAATDSQMSLHGTDAFEDLVSAPQMILENYIRNNFPMHLETDSSLNARQLNALEFQVWEHCNGWKSVPSVEEIIRNGHSEQSVARQNLPPDDVSTERILTSEEAARLNCARQGGFVKTEKGPNGRTAQAKNSDHQASRAFFIERKSLAQHNIQVAREASRNARQLEERLRGFLGAAMVGGGSGSGGGGGGGHAEGRHSVIDLTADSDDDVYDDIHVKKEITRGDGCIQCDQPSDIAMATCTRCKGRIHVAWIDMKNIPTNYTCEECETIDIKPAVGLAQWQPDSTDMLIMTNSIALLSDAELSAKTPQQLRDLIREAKKNIALAQDRVRKAESKLDTVENTPIDMSLVPKILKSFSGSVGQPKALRETYVSANENLNESHCVSVKPRSNIHGGVPDSCPEENRGVHRDVTDALVNMRFWLMTVATGGLQLPPNPLDFLIDLMGGRDVVAELTGRKGYVEKEEGRASYKTRTDDDGPACRINIMERDRFMNGEKRIAIISEAASTGISLQSDKRYASRNFRRLHITLELPWAADRAIQQFGRSHRANQQSAPVYTILVTPCGGEYRFASAAAKRLQSLGALLKGDRNAVGAGSQLKEFDVDNNAGSKALQEVMQFLMFSDAGHARPMLGVTVPEMPPEFLTNEDLDDESGAAQQRQMNGMDEEQRGLMNTRENERRFRAYFSKRLIDLGMGSSGNNKVPTFLNRLLGLPIAEQDLLFRFFSDTYDAVVQQLRSEGKLDAGIVSFTARTIAEVGSRTIHNDPATGSAIKRVELALDSGTPFEEALEILRNAKERMDGHVRNSRPHLSGFYVLRRYSTNLGRQGVQPLILLATEILNEQAIRGHTDLIKLIIKRPYGCDGFPRWTFKDLRQKNYRMIEPELAKPIWDAWATHALTGCRHGINCSTDDCTDGNRFQKVYLLTGAVLNSWQRLTMLRSYLGHAKKIERTYTIRVAHVDGNESRVVRKVLENPPLMVRRAVTREPGNPERSGKPFVGIMADNLKEMDGFEKHLVPPENPKEDVLYHILMGKSAPSNNNNNSSSSSSSRVAAAANLREGKVSGGKVEKKSMQKKQRHFH